MAQMSQDSNDFTPVVDSLRQSTWTTSVVVAGLLGLLAWRSIAWIDRDWLATFPGWLVLAVTTVIPYLFLLFYPLVTRQRPHPSRLRLPSLQHLLIEAVLAVPIVVGCILFVQVLQFVISQLSPDTSLVPEVYDRMTNSTGTPLVYVFLLAGCLCAPIAEEVFFRGFLFNAFRKRMPFIVAALLQSAIFGFGHLYSWAPALGVTSLGLIFTMVYYWRRTIVAPIFVHASYNGLLVAVMLLAMHANANAPSLGVTADQAAEDCTIQTVIPDSPAESAGLLPGDTITHVDEYTIADFQDLVAAIRCFEVGDTVTVTVNRNGADMHFEAVLVPRSALSP